jgi:hypothetical protein
MAIIQTFKRKSNLPSIPTSITEYIDAFPKFLKGFFEKNVLQLESKKIFQ